jgi:hypothetical protein
MALVASEYRKQQCAHSIRPKSPAAPTLDSIVYLHMLTTACPSYTFKVINLLAQIENLQRESFVTTSP